MLDYNQEVKVAGVGPLRWPRQGVANGNGIFDVPGKDQLEYAVFGGFALHCTRSGLGRERLQRCNLCEVFR